MNKKQKKNLIKRLEKRLKEEERLLDLYDDDQQEGLIYQHGICKGLWLGVGLLKVGLSILDNQDDFDEELDPDKANRAEPITCEGCQ